MDSIHPYDIWKQIKDLQLVQTAGYMDDIQFNLDIKSVNYQLFDILYPFYEGNSQVEAALRPLLANTQLAKAANVAFVTFPAALYKEASINIIVNSLTYPATKLRKNSKAAVLSSGVRAPSSPYNLCIEISGDRKCYVFPATLLCTVDINYFTEPTAGSLTMTAVAGATSDYLQFSSQVDVPYDNSVFNLYLYLMLERLGIKMEDQLMVEYSKLGIDRNLINPNPKTV